MLDELGHLRCEIEELELEIENHEKAIQNLINIQNRRKQKLEELQRQKPITLECIIAECMMGHNYVIQLELLENILDRVEVEFFPKGKNHQNEYSEGWNDCVRELKKRLRE